MIIRRQSSHASRILITDSDTIRTLTPPEYQRIRSAEEAEERRRQDLLDFLGYLAALEEPFKDPCERVEEYLVMSARSAK